MERYYFFDSNTDIGDRRLYSAADWSKVLSKFLENGIYNEGDNLEVTADGLGMEITIGTGIAFMFGRMYENDAPLTLNIDAAEATLDRIDLVVLRLDLSEQNRYIRCFVVKGVPDGAPVAPITQNTTFIKEIALAEVRVTAAKSTIDLAQITDMRLTDFVDPFADGSRITTLEQNSVPYEGATRDLDMAKKNITNVSGYDIVGDDPTLTYFSRLDQSSGIGRFMTRLMSDKSFHKYIMTWNEEGILNLPNQSEIFYTAPGPLSITSGVDTKVSSLSSKLIDKQNEFLNARYTAKESGSYLVRTYSDWGTATPPPVTLHRVYKNGSNFSTMGYGFNARYTAGLILVSMLPGDYIEFYVNQDSGTTKSVTGGSIQIIKIS